MKQIDKNTFEAENWKELQNYLFGDDVYEADKDRYRSKLAYRGVSDKNYRLETSIQRIGRVPSSVESHLIRNFKKYSPINTLVDDYNNIWNWISLGQHHGLPTRLLDWTFSPNVALHFMTDDISTFGKDGIVWIVNYFEIQKLFPKSLQEKLNAQNTLSFTSTELNLYIGTTIEEINEFYEQNNKEDVLMFFEPPSIDERIVNQFALFSFTLNPNTDKLDWLNQHPDLFKKIIVPSQLKWEIRDKLDQSNITERIIYPGLDGISKWLARWYREKDESKKWKL